MIIPQTDLLKELQENTQSISELIEPLHAYLFHLSSGSKKKDRVKPNAFYFALSSTWELESALDSVLELYKLVAHSLLLLSEIESRKGELEEYKELTALLSTTFALSDNIPDISAQVLSIKDRTETASSKAFCKKLFYYVESVRALTEELNLLKSIALDEIIASYSLLFASEPLDLKEDLE